MFIKGNMFDERNNDLLNVTLFNDGGAGAEDDAIDEDLDNDDWTPPTREEWEKDQADKKKAIAEATARKQMLRDNGIDLRTGKARKSDSSKSSVEEDDEDSVYVPTERDKKVFNKEAILALKEAGVKGSKAKLLARDIDITEWLEDDDYLDSRIDELKDEYPDLFETEEDDEEEIRPRKSLGLKKNTRVKKEVSETDQLLANGGFRR